MSHSWFTILINTSIIFLIILLNLQSGVYAQQFSADPENTNFYNTKDLWENPEIRWIFRTEGRVNASPLVHKNTVYCGSTDGNLYAIHAVTGKKIWKFKTEGEVNSTPALNNGKLFFCSMDGGFYCISINNGTLIWKFQTNGEKRADIWDYFLSSPAVHENSVYFGSGDHNFYSLDITTGRKIWQFATNGIVHSSPAIDSHSVYFGSFDGNLYALDLRTGTLKWKFKTVGDRWFPSGEVQCGPSVSDGLVFFGSRDYNIYALNAETGTGMWNMKENFSWVIPAPSIMDTTVYFGTSDSHNFYAMDKRYGTVLWKAKVNLNIFGSCAIGKKMGYFGSLDGKLYGVDLDDGDIRWIFQTASSRKNYPNFFNQEGNLRSDLMTNYSNDLNAIYSDMLNMGSILSAPVIDNGIIYMGSADSCIYSLY